MSKVTFRNRRSGQTVCFELFHRWHKTLLARRLDQLGDRPDPQLFLGVDRSLLRDDALKSRVESHEQVMLFTSFPTTKRIRSVLDKLSG